MIKDYKGFALVLSLVLLLAMSLMGGALIVIASSDHQGNNSSDEYQQTFYVAETALMQAEKSLIDKMMGPIGTGGDRDQSRREIPRNAEASDPGPTQTPCFKSFKNLSRDADFRVTEHIQDQSFLTLIRPLVAVNSEEEKKIEKYNVKCKLVELDLNEPMKKWNEKINSIGPIDVFVHCASSDLNLSSSNHRSPISESSITS